MENKGGENANLCNVMRGGEQMLRQLRVQKLARARALRRHPKEPPEEGVDPPLLREAEGGEEGSVEHEVPLGDRLEGSVEAGQDRVDEGVTKPERCRRKLVAHLRCDQMQNLTQHLTLILTLTLINSKLNLQRKYKKKTKNTLSFKFHVGGGCWEFKDHV